MTLMFNVVGIKFLRRRSIFKDEQKVSKKPHPSSTASFLDRCHITWSSTLKPGVQVTSALS
jgi:hypothetical protein